MPQMAWLFSTAHVDGSRTKVFRSKDEAKDSKHFERNFRLEKGRMDCGSSRAWIILEMIERGTAAQGVPVRQIRVAELDDDVAVLSSGQLEETKRDRRFRALRNSERNSRGRGLRSV